MLHIIMSHYNWCVLLHIRLKWHNVHGILILTDVICSIFQLEWQYFHLTRARGKCDMPFIVQVLYPHLFHIILQTIDLDVVPTMAAAQYANIFL